MVPEDWDMSVKEGSAPRDLTQTPLGFPLGLEYAFAFSSVFCLILSDRR